MKISNTIMFLSFSGVFAFIFFRIISRMDKKTTEGLMDTNEFIIRKSKPTLMMYFCMVFSVFVGVAARCETTTDFIFLLFLSLLCILFIILWLRWKIVVKENQITFTPHIGKAKTFTFANITNVIRRDIISRLGVKLGEDIIAYYRTEDKLSSIYVTSYDPYYYVLTSRLENEDVPIEDKRK